VPRVSSRVVPVARLFRLSAVGIATKGSAYRRPLVQAQGARRLVQAEGVFPDIVKERDGIKTVQYDRFGILLLPIVRSLKERLDALEKENAQLTRLLKEGVH